MNLSGTRTFFLVDDPPRTLREEALFDFPPLLCAEWAKWDDIKINRFFDGYYWNDPLLPEQVDICERVPCFFVCFFLVVAVMTVETIMTVLGVDNWAIVILSIRMYLKAKFS